jgi:dihydrofolate reductase
MKTQYYTATSLDGFIATPDDSLEWLFPLGDVNETSYPQFIVDAGLLDELIVQVGSVTLGAGKPLFPRMIASPPLQLTSAQRIGPGFAELRYSVPQRPR